MTIAMHPASCASRRCRQCGQPQTLRHQTYTNHSGVGACNCVRSRAFAQAEPYTLPTSPLRVTEFHRCGECHALVPESHLEAHVDWHVSLLVELERV